MPDRPIESPEGLFLRGSLFFLAGNGVFLATAGGRRYESATMIRIGEPAPDFEAKTTTGVTLKLSAMRGRIVVLYFFPKAFTPG